MPQAAVPAAAQAAIGVELRGQHPAAGEGDGGGERQQGRRARPNGQRLYSRKPDAGEEGELEGQAEQHDPWCQCDRVRRDELGSEGAPSGGEAAERSMECA